MEHKKKVFSWIKNSEFSLFVDEYTKKSNKDAQSITNEILATEEFKNLSEPPSSHALYQRVSGIKRPSKRIAINDDTNIRKFSKVDVSHPSKELKPEEPLDTVPKIDVKFQRAFTVFDKIKECYFLFVSHKEEGKKSEEQEEKAVEQIAFQLDGKIYVRNFMISLSESPSPMTFPFTSENGKKTIWKSSHNVVVKNIWDKSITINAVFCPIVFICENGEK